MFSFCRSQLMGLQDLMSFGSTRKLIGYRKPIAFQFNRRQIFSVY